MKHGLGAIAALGAEARSLGMKRPLLVTDPGIVKAGLLQLANETWKKWLAAYQQPPIGPAVDEALREYIAKRKLEISAQTG